MNPLDVVEGVAAPLPLANVDTDVIIRIEHLARSPRHELGRYAFAPLRFDANGAERTDFVLNQPPWRGAPILVAGANFGCGSSREQAVWALQGLGIRCVIAESFGDIFRNNCFENGVLPVQLAPNEVGALLEMLDRQGGQQAAVHLRVDLRAQFVQAPQQTWHFAVDDRRKHQLLNGLDAVASTLAWSSAIDAWQQRDRLHRPWLWAVNASTLATDR